MTLGYLADTLDLSRLPAPEVVREIDYEAIRAEAIADVVARLAAVGIELDTAELESEPVAIIMQAAAWREALAKAEMNDRAKSVMLAFATKGDLEHIAARLDVARMLITPATNNTPEVLESDDSLRRRALLAPEAFSSAGTAGGYLFHALSADPRVLNADIWSPEPGSVTVAIQSREGNGMASDELIEAVRAHLAQDHIKPLTDTLSVRSVTNVPYTISVQGFVLPGPAPALVREQMIASLTTMAALRRTPSRDVPLSAVTTAASVGAIDKVLVLSPEDSIARDRGEVAICTDIAVSVETYAG